MSGVSMYQKFIDQLFRTQNAAIILVERTTDYSTYSWMQYSKMKSIMKEDDCRL